MNQRPTIAEQLARQGISRRAFLKFCAATASLMALPPGMAPAIRDLAVVPGMHGLHGIPDAFALTNG